MNRRSSHESARRTLISWLSLASSACIALALPGQASADPFCSHRVYTVANPWGAGDCWSLCQPGCGASNAQLLSVGNSSTSLACICTCANVCGSVLYGPRTPTGCDPITSGFTCQHAPGCSWDAAAGHCRSAPLGRSTSPAYAPNTGPAPLSSYWLGAGIGAAECEVLADGSAACNQPVCAYYPEQVSGPTGGIGLLVSLEDESASRTFQSQLLSTVPQRTPPAASYLQMAYGSGGTAEHCWETSANRFDFRSSVPRSVLEASRLSPYQRPRYRTRYEGRLDLGVRGDAAIDCVMPERFVQYLLAYGRSSPLLPVGSPNDIAGVCETCAGMTATIDQISPNGELASYYTFRNARTYAAPVNPSVTSVPPLVYAFTHETALLAAAELVYTGRQITAAYRLNSQASDQLFGAIGGGIVNWSHSIPASSLEAARFVYQVDKTAREVEAFAYRDIFTGDNLNAFDRYTGRATPALDASDWRNELFKSVCPAPELCNKSQAAAIQALRRAAGDMRTVIAEQRRLLPWLGSFMQTAAFTRVPMSDDATFRAALEPVLVAFYTPLMTEASSRARDMRLLGLYLDCTGSIMDPVHILGGPYVAPGYSQVEVQTLVEPRFDELMAYASRFPVSREPRPVTATPAERKAALFLSSAFAKIQARREARAPINAANKALEQTALVLAVALVTYGTGLLDIPFTFLSTRIGSAIASSRYARIGLGGFAAASEAGALAHFANTCEDLLVAADGDEYPSEGYDLQQYFDCVHAAQWVAVGGLFSAVATKTANAIGTRLSWATAAVARFTQPVRPFLWPARRPIQRALDMLLDARILLPHPNGLPANSPEALAYLERVLAKVRPAAYAPPADFAAAKASLAATLRNEIAAGLNADHASNLRILAERGSAVELTTDLRNCYAETGTSTPRIVTTVDMPSFWHESSHAYEAVAKILYGADHLIASPALNSSGNTEAAWRVFSELSASTRAEGRNVERALQDVRLRYKYLFDGDADHVGWYVAIPELREMTALQQLTFFRLAQSHPRIKTIEYTADIRTKYVACDPDLMTLIMAVERWTP